MQIRLNRDPLKIAAAALTPVFLTLLLAKAAAPVADEQDGQAAKPADAPPVPEMVENGASLEPVRFGQEANAPSPQVEVAATNPATGSAGPPAANLNTRAVSTPAVAFAQPPAAPVAAPGARRAEAANSAVEADQPGGNDAATAVEPSLTAAAPVAAEPVEPVLPQVAAAPQGSPPLASDASAASISPSPDAAPIVAGNAREDAARVAAALDNAKSETARAEALANSPPAGPQVLPETKLALADWNYSLPPSPSGVSGFADSARAQGFGSAPSQPAASAPPASGKAKPRLAQSSAQPTGKKAAISGTRRAGARLAAAPPAHSKYRMVGSAIEFQLPVQVDGEAIGQLTMHVVPNQPVALHLKELVSLFATQIDPQELQALNASSNIDQYISFERLREAGIDIRYDAARDQIKLAVEQP